MLVMKVVVNQGLLVRIKKNHFIFDIALRFYGFLETALTESLTLEWRTVVSHRFYSCLCYLL